MEATYINHNFSQQCLRMVRPSSPGAVFWRVRRRLYSDFFNKAVQYKSVKLTEVLYTDVISVLKEVGLLTVSSTTFFVERLSPLSPKEEIPLPLVKEAGF